MKSSTKTKGEKKAVKKTPKTASKKTQEKTPEISLPKNAFWFSWKESPKRPFTKFHMIVDIDDGKALCGIKALEDVPYDDICNHEYDPESMNSKNTCKHCIRILHEKAQSKKKPKAKETDVVVESLQKTANNNEEGETQNPYVQETSTFCWKEFSGRGKWTKSHIVKSGKTLCGLIVPKKPFDSCNIDMKGKYFIQNILCKKCATLLNNSRKKTKEKNPPKETAKNSLPEESKKKDTKAITPEPKPKFKVGDRIKLKKSNHTGTIEALDIKEEGLFDCHRDPNETYHKIKFNCSPYPLINVRTEDLKKIKETPEPQFKVGDRVKYINENSKWLAPSSKGIVVSLVKYDGSIDVEFESIWNIQTKYLEKIEETPEPKIKVTQEERLDTLEKEIKKLKEIYHF